MAMQEAAKDVNFLTQEMGTVRSENDYARVLSPTRSVAAQSAIVVPCYNESTRLPVDEFERFLDSDQEGSVLIFVDDGSRDQTAEILERIRKNNVDRVVVLQLPVNRGKAEAVRFGINYALEQYLPFVGFWDADLATPLAAIASFVDLLRNRPELDMVFGARVRLLGRQIERRANRHYMGRAFATAASLALRLPIYDTQCGAKVFRCTPQMRTVFAKPFMSRWIFDVEIIARYISVMKSPDEATRHIYEFPLTSWVDVQGSKLGPHDFVRAAYELARIGLKYKV